MRLYELSTQYLALSTLVAEGTTDPVLLDKALTELNDIIETKIENIGKLILSMEADNNILKTEEQRLASRRITTEKQIDHLKNYLLDEMTTCQLEKVKKPLVTIAIRTNPPSVNVVNQNDIPQEYRRVIPETWQVDKLKILEQFKSTGEIVNGVNIIVDKKSISVK